MTRRTLRAAITMTCLAALAALAACDVTSGPSQLDRARVLAVRLSPAHLAPAEVSPIDVLVGTPGGEVAVVAPGSVHIDGAPGAAAEEMVVRGEDGWALVCPSESVLAAMRAALEVGPDDPVPVPVTIEVDVDGEPLTATKFAFLGSAGANPTLDGISVSGAQIDDQGIPVVTSGDEVDIAVQGAAGETELSYAWYSSVGDIDLYLSEEAVLTAEGPATGQLAMVVRDQRGGVAWSTVEVRVE